MIVQKVFTDADTDHWNDPLSITGPKDMYDDELRPHSILLEMDSYNRTKHHGIVVSVH